MKTPQELDALKNPSRAQKVRASLDDAFERAYNGGRITEKGGLLECAGLTPEDYRIVIQFFTDNHWNISMKYADGKYAIKLEPSTVSSRRDFGGQYYGRYSRSRF